MIDHVFGVFGISGVYRFVNRLSPRIAVNHLTRQMDIYIPRTVDITLYDVQSTNLYTIHSIKLYTVHMDVNTGILFSVEDVSCVLRSTLCTVHCTN